MANIEGTNGSDFLLGDISGLPEDDLILAFAGDDLVIARGGNDTLVGLLEMTSSKGTTATI